MSGEAEILGIIDAIVGEFLVGETPGVRQRAADLSTRAAEAASALELVRTAEAAQSVAALASSVGGAGTRVELERAIEQLQRAVDSELSERLSQPNARPSQEAETLAEFALESREHLESIFRELLALETAPDDVESLHAIFRGFHTIKGLAAISGLGPVRDLAHEVEAVLDLMRSRRLAAGPPLMDLLLACADHFLALVQTIEQSGGRYTALPESPDLVERLRQAAHSAVVSPGESPAATPDGPAPGERRHGAPTVKVDTARLDHLVDTVGELVIAQSLVQMDPALSSAGDRLSRNLLQLARITAELQKTAMSLRIVPVRGVFQRMARAFRDLARKAGKQARIELSGEDAELDRTIVEQLADPLLHMVRNAVDHGLETVAERLAAGKTPEGLLRLAASHHSGQIVIEVADDGRGLDRRKILAKAVERGIVSPEASLAPNEILELIFEPGFSTAERVTDVSGRGVGMDVVRRQIQRLRGRVEIRSEEGKGTTFLLGLPLTLAIIDGLMVRIGIERFIVPLFSVREIFQPEPGSIFRVDGRQEVVLLRGRILPVLRLHELLGREPESADPYRSVLVTVDLNGRQFCLLADETVGTQEVVIKSLGGWLGLPPGVSGAAILGDGCVGLILDLEELVAGQIHTAV